MKQALIFLARLLKFSLIFFAVCVPVMLLGVILLAFYLPFSRHPQLPLLLRWWDCADFYVGRDTSTYEGIVKEGVWRRYCWLAFRNPMNYFDYRYLGLTFKNNMEYPNYDPEGSRVNNNDRAGLRHIELVNGDGKKYFEYFYIKRWPFYPSLCIRFRMGWKIKDNQNEEGETCQWCLVLNPWMGFTGTDI